MTKKKTEGKHDEIKKAVKELKEDIPKNKGKWDKEAVKITGQVARIRRSRVGLAVTIAVSGKNMNVTLYIKGGGKLHMRFLNAWRDGETIDVYNDVSVYLAG